MHIISTSDQSIIYIPRTTPATTYLTADSTLVTVDSTLYTADVISQNTPYTYILTDEQKKVATTGTLEVALYGNYYTSTLDFSSVDGHFYTLELKYGSNVQYRGKLFCTDQTEFDKYTTQDGVYSAVSSTNTYEIVE
jgi:hypothetical protein